MALTVGNLYKESIHYKMRLLAGEEGLHNLVQWVHIIETQEGAQFLHGQEIVIIEGVLEHEEENLLALVKTVQMLNASAVILNTGMFIRQVPHAIIEFCDKEGLPLFEIPWEIPLVDVTRNFCQRIMDSAVKEDNAATTFKNIIFDIGDKESLIHQMERLGYVKDSSMFILCASIELEKATEEFVTASRKLKLLSESTARTVREQYISFEYQEKRIVVLTDYTDEETEVYIDRLLKELAANTMLPYVYIGTGDNMNGLENQAVNFKRAWAACEIACRKREHILKYPELDLYKLLINISRKEVLTDFYEETFGKLMAYDREKGTDFHRFIKTYVECDGHQGEVGNRLFIHRNTVNNYLKKAEEIMNMDLNSMKGRSVLYAAYCLEDLL